MMMITSISGKAKRCLGSYLGSPYITLAGISICGKSISHPLKQLAITSLFQRRLRTAARMQDLKPEVLALSLSGASCLTLGFDCLTHVHRALESSQSYCFTHVHPVCKMRSAIHMQIDIIENKVAVACIFNNYTKIMGFVKCKQQQLEIKKKKKISPVVIVFLPDMSIVKYP